MKKCFIIKDFLKTCFPLVKNCSGSLSAKIV